ncbi:hypothetical protein SZN_17587 [Streptomyces zinciresistens K42]|uniref:Uncharacterized protein n=2 Tax=Streptomyces TaxID=1883 RepID=G2GDE0_9ACTN|nr:hypothetical protein SZN_17587 [Streptomyces zinciresistens K42]
MVTAPAAAAADGKYHPAGIGDLMPSPLKPPGGQGTLFESYPANTFQLDKQLSDDLTGGDLIDGSMHQIASLLMAILTMIGRAAITIMQWTFKAVSLPEIEPAISRAIGAAAQPMVTMFLPAALAVGMFIAWARRSDTSMLGQLVWVAASAAIATTLLTSPQTWVKGVDEARQAGSNVAMTTLSGGLAGDTSNALPFKTPTPTWSDNDRDNAVRKASDAVWRTYVAVPWCVADLGSIEACKRWGPDVVKLRDDMDKREDYLAENMNSDNAGHEAVQWRQGHTPSGRLGVLLAAVITAVIFCALVIILAAATLASLLGALMLLVCGVVFACLWCIPGKPRQWGVAWVEALAGTVLTSMVAMMLLGSVMILNMAMISLLNVYGWLIVSLLNIATAGTALKLKSQLDGIVSGGGAQLAGRGVLSTLGSLATARRLRSLRPNSSGGGSGGLIGAMRRGGGRAGSILGGIGSMGGIIRDRWGRGGGGGEGEQQAASAATPARAPSASPVPAPTPSRPASPGCPEAPTATTPPPGPACPAGPEDLPAEAADQDLARCPAVRGSPPTQPPHAQPGRKPPGNGATFPAAATPSAPARPSAPAYRRTHGRTAHSPSPDRSSTRTTRSEPGSGPTRPRPPSGPRALGRPRLLPAAGRPSAARSCAGLNCPRAAVVPSPPSGSTGPSTPSSHA